jgi:hypothetical protein
MNDASAAYAGLLQRLLDTAARLAQTPPPPGHLRGIDFYTPAGYGEAMARSLQQFHFRHGRWPALTAPATYTDKLYCSKFFRPLPWPTPADKCRVAAFIPPAFADRVRPMPLAWTSTTPGLAADDALAPGRWWLKANHGSGMNRALDWPPTPAARAEAVALGARWLQTCYGLVVGEWWYARIPPTLMLVREIANAIDCKFCMIHGRIRYVLVAFDLPDGRRARSFYDPDAALQGEWRHLDLQLTDSPNPPVPRPGALETACAFAMAVGARFEQVRVDLLHAPDDALYLTELTLCDMDARVRFTPADFDAALGADWDVSAWYA